MRRAAPHFLTASLSLISLLGMHTHAQVAKSCSARQLTAYCASVPSSWTSTCPGCTNSYLVRSYQGRLRCLDYTPEIIGSPVVLNDCGQAHPIVVEELPDGKHTVVLHAGTKVIGVKTNPIVTKGAAAPSSVTPGAPLELQNANGGIGSPVATGDQFFALDGDSIVLASNRNLVAQVRNARGALGSPLVVGLRQLADNEFWDFLPIGNSALDPTSGFVRIGYAGDPYCATPAMCACRLFNVVNAAGPGTVVKLGTSIDLTDCGSLRVRQPITIRGDRRGTLVAPQLLSCFVVKQVIKCDTSTNSAAEISAMISLEADDIRITGLRLHGPSRSSDRHQTEAAGVVTSEANLRNIIDHNDVSDWTEVGLEVRGDDTTAADGSRGSCPAADPAARPTTAFIARNFVHHNEKQDDGYGVESYKGSYPFFYGNTFVSNRHAVAAGFGTSHTSYRAWDNLVLSAAPIQVRLDIIKYHTHDFDMHGLGTNGYGGLGGDYVDVYKNTFLGLKNKNFELRGDPCHYIEFHNNISLQGEGSAVSWRTCFVCFFASAASPSFFRISSHPDQFHHANPVSGTKALGVGDFDGDGVDDLFLATGQAWYYSPAGKTEWRFLSEKTDTIGQLLFGDFDGDGRTDVVAIHDGQFVVSWGGISAWEVLNPDPTAGRLFLLPSAAAAMTAGRFAGNRTSDIFWADGKTWWLSHGGNRPFVEIQTSGFQLPDLRFGDFNSDGKTDIFSVGSKNWQVSYAPTSGPGPFSSWQALRTKLTGDARSLIVADFDGDGVADVAADCPGEACWRISYQGQTGWKKVPQPVSLGEDFAAVGHFNGTKGTDVLTWNDTELVNQSGRDTRIGKCDNSHGQDTQLCISVAAAGTATHYSTQDMR